MNDSPSTAAPAAQPMTYPGGPYPGGFGLPIAVGWLGAAVMAGLLSVLVGLLTIRLRADYLAIATFGFAVAEKRAITTLAAPNGAISLLPAVEAAFMPDWSTATVWSPSAKAAAVGTVARFTWAPPCPSEAARSAPTAS